MKGGKTAHMKGGKTAHQNSTFTIVVAPSGVSVPPSCQRGG